MQIEVQNSYKAALRFAAEKHKDQKENGTDLPYVVHLVSVATEIFVSAVTSPGLDLSFLVTVTLLHDVLEDTDCTPAEIEQEFGAEVMEAVTALTKSPHIDNKEERLLDSLRRIRSLRKEVWMVKLADRITNLDAPSLPWPEDKRKRYMQGSNFILDELQDANDYLANRLRIKIKEYVDYVVVGV